MKKEKKTTTYAFIPGFDSNGKETKTFLIIGDSKKNIDPNSIVCKSKDFFEINENGFFMNDEKVVDTEKIEELKTAFPISEKIIKS